MRPPLRPGRDPSPQRGNLLGSERLPLGRHPHRFILRRDPRSSSLSSGRPATIARAPDSSSAGAAASLCNRKPPLSASGPWQAKQRRAKLAAPSRRSSPRPARPTPRPLRQSIRADRHNHRRRQPYSHPPVAHQQKSPPLAASRLNSAAISHSIIAAAPRSSETQPAHDPLAATAARKASPGTAATPPRSARPAPHSHGSPGR